jgi:hypothetical protein
VSLASGITGRVRGFEGAILSLSSSMQCQSSICICKCVLSSVVDVVGVVSLLSVIEYGERRAINSHRASWSRQIAEPRFPANPCKSLPTRLRGTTHLLTDYTQVIIFGNHPQVSHIFQSSNSRNHGFTLDGENHVTSRSEPLTPSPIQLMMQVPAIFINICFQTLIFKLKYFITKASWGFEYTGNKRGQYSCFSRIHLIGLPKCPQPLPRYLVELSCNPSIAMLLTISSL